MILFYSGTSGIRVDPEMVVGDKAAIMLSYYDSSGKKVQPRFKRVYKARKKKGKKK